MSLDVQQSSFSAPVGASAAADGDSSLSHTRVASLSQLHRRDAAEDDSVLLVPGTHVVASTIVAPPPSPLPVDDSSPHAPTVSRPSSALAASFTLPAARSLSSTAASSFDALNTSDGGVQLSGEKPVRSLTGSLQPTASVPTSRQLSRQSSNSDATLPTRSSSVQPYDSARVLRVTNEALSLRKQSLRHAAGSLAPQQPIEDVNTLRALLSFQNKEIAAYKQQITTLTTDNNRLAAEVRAFPHSASEVNRVISSLREERTRMDGRIRALEGEKKVWAQQMRNLHGEMNSMEREWIKDRQRLEEAVRREEERNERLMADWDDREERMDAMARERKREVDEHDRLKVDIRVLEKRLEVAQAEYARVVNAWREERMMGSEVEGRLRGEVYSRLFAVLREVAEKEAESREWEREMGRKREVQVGVEEMERRYVRLLAAVGERDELLNRLQEDNRRLLAIMQDESRMRVRSMQSIHSSNVGRTADTSPQQMMSPAAAPAASHRIYDASHSSGAALSSSNVAQSTSVSNVLRMAVTSPPFANHKSADVVGESALPLNASSSAQRTGTDQSQLQRLPSAAGDGAAVAGPISAVVNSRTLFPTSALLSFSSPSPPAAVSTTQPNGRVLDVVAESSASIRQPTLLASPASAPQPLKSPTSFLSAFFTSAAATLTTGNSGGGGNGNSSGQQAEEDSELQPVSRAALSGMA